MCLSVIIVPNGPFCDLPFMNYIFNPSNTELNPIFHLLKLLGSNHILHISGLRINIMVSTLVSVRNTVYLDTIKAESLKLSIWDNTELCGLTFRHRASCILGQAFHYSPENAFYIFNQQIYFII